MRVEDFNFELPQELIAQRPLEKRDASRLMKIDRATGEITHSVFHDITKFLKSGDCLVLNNTRVIPARLIGQREDSGARVEFLLLKRLSQRQWEAIVYPGKKVRPGKTIVFGGGELAARVLEVKEDGNRVVEFTYEGVFEQVLDRLGEMPLPHYITEKLTDKERYQTVYSKYDGSAAAPTAGLHFTPQLLERIEDMGVELAYLTLHVGLGTFRPVKAQTVEEHVMHSEWYHIDEIAAQKINRCKERGGRVIAVGTTSCRTLESVGDERGWVKATSGETNIFIYPGYRFKVLDGLITNFHLPQSTLIMLVSAFLGYENTMEAYRTAVEEKYRFFSFGDSMMIL